MTAHDRAQAPHVGAGFLLVRQGTHSPAGAATPLPSRHSNPKKQSCEPRSLARGPPIVVKARANHKLGFSPNIIKHLTIGCATKNLNHRKSLFQFLRLAIGNFRRSRSSIQIGIPPSRGLEPFPLAKTLSRHVLEPLEAPSWERSPIVFATTSRPRGRRARRNQTSPKHGSTQAGRARLLSRGRKPRRRRHQLLPGARVAPRCPLPPRRMRSNGMPSDAASPPGTWGKPFCFSCRFEPRPRSEDQPRRIRGVAGGRAWESREGKGGHGGLLSPRHFHFGAQNRSTFLSTLCLYTYC